MFRVEYESWAAERHYMSLRGTGKKEEFRIYVQNYLNENSDRRARFSYQETWENAIKLINGEFVAIIQVD